MDEQTPEKIERDKLKLPVAKQVPVAMTVDAPGIQVEFRKLNEIGDMLWLPVSLSAEEHNARIIRAIEFYEGLKPKGSAEGMLATQMCNRRSNTRRLRHRGITGSRVDGGP